MELFKKGFLRVHGTHNVNRDMSKSEVVNRLAHINSQSNLNNVLDGPDTQYISRLSDGSLVSIVSPNSPYSEGAVMIIAATKGSLVRKDMRTDFIYDYPDDVQNEYWKLILASMIATDKIIPKKERKKNTVIAVENCISTISTLDHRTSRTMVLPHAQIIKLDAHRIEPGSMKIDSLEHEQTIFSRFDLLHKFVDGVNQKMLQQKNTKNISAYVQKPFGYFINTSISINEAIKHTDQIKNIMRNHHQAYARMAQEAIDSLTIRNKKRIIPQPSYRLLLYFDKNSELCIGISPEFLSHVGPLEAAGIILERNPSFTRYYNDKELLAYKEKLLKKIILETSNSM